MDSLWPWSFLNPHLQWHGYAMPQCRGGAWHVRRCLLTSSWKWKHGTSRNVMPSFVCVKLGDIATITHGILQQAFGDDAMSRKEAFSLAQNVFWRQNPCWRWAAQRMTISNTDRWNTARVRELIRYDRRLTVRMIADEVTMNRETVRLIQTEELGDEKNLWSSGAQESHRAATRCAVEGSFWHPTALRWCRSLLRHLISHLASYFYFKK